MYDSPRDRTKTCPGCRRRGPATQEVCGRCGTDLIEVEPDPETPAIHLPFRRPYRRDQATLHAVPLPPHPVMRRGASPPASRAVPAVAGKRWRLICWVAGIVVLLLVGSLAALTGSGERNERDVRRRTAPGKVARAKAMPKSVVRAAR